jgi:uncharacterized protein
MRYIALLLTLSAGLFATAPAKQIDSMTATMAEQHKLPSGQQPEMTEMTKRMFTILGDQLSWEKMKPVYEKIYGDIFDEDEIDALLVFYRSPAGQISSTRHRSLWRKAGKRCRAGYPS